MIEDGGLRGREIESFGHEKLLRLASVAQLPGAILVEEDSLVCDVLIDQQQAFVVGRDDEALVELAQRADVCSKAIPVSGASRTFPLN